MFVETVDQHSHVVQPKNALLLPLRLFDIMEFVIIQDANLFLHIHQWMYDVL
jgi:hypothetical protein